MTKQSAKKSTTAPAAQPPAPVSYPARLLATAAAIIERNGPQRDTGAGADGQPQERSMAACVAAFNALEGQALTERQGWAFMQVLKLARAGASARNGLLNLDDYIDGAAYAALAAEAAEAADPGGAP